MSEGKQAVNQTDKTTELLKVAKHFQETDCHVGRNIVTMFDQVNEDTAGIWIKSLLSITNDDPITVLICSPGGDWYAGMAVYDLLRGLDNHVTTVAIGAAMSMGSIILQAGDDRVAMSNATVMVHNGVDAAVGDVEDIKNWAKHSEHIAKQMYKIYSDASGKTVAYWKRRCASDFVMSAQQALKEGLLDRVVTKLPK